MRLPYLSIISFPPPTAALLAALLAAAGLSAAERALFLEPSSGAPVFARVAADSPVVEGAVPVLSVDGVGKGPWMWSEYEAAFEGFVPDAAVSKNFEVTLGTPVRLRAAGDAPQITRIDEDDTYEVLSGGSGWTRLRLTKPLPVYLRTPEVTAPPTPLPPPPAAPRTDPPRRRAETGFDPDGTVGALEPTALPPENARWRPASARAAKPPQAPAARAAPTVVAQGNDGAARPPRSPAPPPGAPTRTLAGTLTRTLPNPFGGSRYPLRLNGPGGDRLAYVDASRLFIRDFRPYLDRRVVVTGEIRPLVAGSTDLVIVTRTLRVAD